MRAWIIGSEQCWARRWLRPLWYLEFMPPKVIWDTSLRLLSPAKLYLGIRAYKERSVWRTETSHPNSNFNSFPGLQEQIIRIPSLSKTATMTLSNNDTSKFRGTTPLTSQAVQCSQDMPPSWPSENANDDTESDTVIDSESDTEMGFEPASDKTTVEGDTEGDTEVDDYCSSCDESISVGGKSVRVGGYTKKPGKCVSFTLSTTTHPLAKKPVLLRSSFKTTREKTAEVLESSLSRENLVRFHNRMHLCWYLSR